MNGMGMVDIRLMRKGLMEVHVTVERVRNMMGGRGWGRVMRGDGHPKNQTQTNIFGPYRLSDGILRPYGPFCMGNVGLTGSLLTAHR